MDMSFDEFVVSKKYFFHTQIKIDHTNLCWIYILCTYSNYFEHISATCLFLNEMIPSSVSGPSAPEHFTVYNEGRGYFGPTTMKWNFDAEECLLRIPCVLHVSNLDPKFCKHVQHSNANFIIIIYPFYSVPSQRVSNILRCVNKSNAFANILYRLNPILFDS